MIGFNSILRDAGVDPAQVKLVRHQDSRGGRTGTTPYQLWLAGDGRLETYQSIQGKDVFDGFRYVASFIVTPGGETVFVGLFENRDRGVAPPGMPDPVTGEDVGGYHLYDLAKSDLLAEYVGRLTIDWGKGYIVWAQNAGNQDKPISEIRRRASEPAFPGLLAFTATIDTLLATPQSWRTVLGAVSGVYLLVCLRTGKQYVGSAYGSGGFWARWLCYAANGHGGNEGLRLDPHMDYQVSILEVAPSSATVDEIIALESRWKDKLLSRQFGLNRN